MTHDELFIEFQNKVHKKYKELHPEDSPMTESETEAYLEGYRAATSWAIDILAKLITQ